MGEDRDFEDYVDDNMEKLLEEFLSSHPDSHKDSYDCHPKWDSFINEKYDQAIITKECDEERP